jgi:hypothetical protein
VYAPAPPIASFPFETVASEAANAVRTAQEHSTQRQQNHLADNPPRLLSQVVRPSALRDLSLIVVVA